MVKKAVSSSDVKGTLKAKSVIKRVPSGSDGYYSGKFPPQATKVGAEAVGKALKRGSIVLTIDGHFRKVRLSQKVQYKVPCPKDRSAGVPGQRYNEYMNSKTLREALQRGAEPTDLFYDTQKLHLAFVPSLQSEKAPGPLPKSEWPSGIRESDRRRPFWLPEDWAHGVKTTCKTYLPVFIAPNGKMYYHQSVIEGIVNQQLGGLEGMIEWAKKSIAEGKDWSGSQVSFSADSRLFGCLTKKEKAHLPPASDLHFCIVSARRATERTGIRGIVNVQTRFIAAGINPRWYVDEASLEDYRRLGLDAVVGGKLTPSRNKALADAERSKKACVQVSDDISRWTYCKTDLAGQVFEDVVEKLQAANAIAKSSDILVISPVAAARFLLAKMRAADTGPRLSGVYPTGNAAFGLQSEAVSTDAFILGDFFVHDRSSVRFDESITLKEDYDFTCSHLQQHGAVLRCNRLILHVAHETNPGGAVAIRDPRGEKERTNIKILMKKWPGVFKLHGTRGDTQVTMRWSRREKAC